MISPEMRTYEVLNLITAMDQIYRACPNAQVIYDGGEWHAINFYTNDETDKPRHVGYVDLENGTAVIGRGLKSGWCWGGDRPLYVSFGPGLPVTGLPEGWVFNPHMGDPNHPDGDQSQIMRDPAVSNRR